MEKSFYLSALFVVMCMAFSCNKDHDNNNHSYESRSLNKRAQILEFSNQSDYLNYVAEQCALGNHENCDELSNGIHEPCEYPGHSGTKHDGTHHDENGHSNDTEHHTNENHGSGGHH